MCILIKDTTLSATLYICAIDVVVAGRIWGAYFHLKSAKEKSNPSAKFTLGTRSITLICLNNEIFMWAQDTSITHSHQGRIDPIIAEEGVDNKIGKTLTHDEKADKDTASYRDNNFTKAAAETGDRWWEGNTRVTRDQSSISGRIFVTKVTHRILDWRVSHKTYESRSTEG